VLRIQQVHGALYRSALRFTRLWLENEQAGWDAGEDQPQIRSAFEHCLKGVAILAGKAFDPHSAGIRFR
jgi:hypothetical protein